MEPGLASIVICCWNNWPDLEMTIESALHQTYRQTEIVVVDNSSTDASLEEVPKRFGGRVRYIRQPNKDTAGAYNTGSAVSNGEYIQFLDGDDVLAPNKIEKQIDVFRANPDADIVYGDIGIFQTSAGRAGWQIIPTKEEEDMLKAVLSSQVGICTDLGTLFHIRALQKIGPWDENLYVEDLDFLLRAAWARCQFCHCPGGPMGFARVHPRAKTANSAAMVAGNEAVWSKALGYVDIEPYRSLLAANLAELRYYQAIDADRSPAKDAFTKLKLARATSPQTISLLKFVAGLVALHVPGAMYVARLPWIRPAVRRVVRMA